MFDTSTDRVLIRHRSDEEITGDETEDEDV